MTKKPTYEELEKRVRELEQAELESKAHEEELKKYRNIVSSTPDGIAYLDKNYRYIIVNDAYEKFSGVERKNFIGLTISEYLGKEVFERLIKPNFERCMKGEIINYQEWFDYPTLGKRFVDINYFPYRDKYNRISGIISDTRDITERKQIEEKLADSERFHRATVENISDTVLITDDQGNFTYICPNTYHIFGMTSDEVTAFGNISFLFSTPIFDHDELSRKKEIRNIESAITDRRGQEHFLLVNVKRVSIKGGTILYACRDVTEIRQKTEKIRTALKEKEILLQELYHRTKNNMLVIISMLSIQSDYIDDESILNIFRDIKNRIHAMALVHEKLYQSKNLSEISLKEYITVLVRLIMESYNIIPDRGISVIYDIDDVCVVIDTAISCGLVLNELISNSLKHAFPGNPKGEIRVRLRKTEPGDTEIIFSDNGVGVPEGFDFRNSPTLGLRLIFVIVEYQLKGNVKFINDNGLICQIRYEDTLDEPRV